VDIAVDYSDILDQFICMMMLQGTFILGRNEFKFDFKFNSFIILSLSIIGCFLPLIFIHQLPNYITNSILADTIRYKDNLRVAYLCSICTTIPLIIDILLDIFSNIKNLKYYDRILISLMIIIPGITFVLYHDDDMFPLIFLGMISAQFGVMIHIIISYIVEFSPQPLLPTSICYLGLFSYYLSTNLLSCSLLVASKSTSIILYITSMITLIISVIILLVITYKWLKYVYIVRNSITSADKYCNERFMISSYLSVLWFATGTATAASALVSFHNMEFYNINSLLIRIISFTVVGVFLSVLPGTK